MSDEKVIEYLLNGFLSFIALLTFLSFIPHVILSSWNDTPLIFYRALMILSGLLLFLESVIISLNGVGLHASVEPELRALCLFFAWIYLLFMVPLVVPFVNTMISAARTTSKVLIFEYRKNSAVLAPPHENEKDPDAGHKYSKPLVKMMTLLTWGACVFCQISSWTQNDAFYELILFRYILSSYIAYLSLFVAISFIHLFHELDKVQKSFEVYQQKAQHRQSTNPQHRSSLSDLNNKEQQNDNSASVDSHGLRLQSKGIKMNTEVIKNIGQHKKRFIKIIVFVALLAALSIYSSVSAYFDRAHIQRIPYHDQPLFFSELKYIVHISSRIVFTLIMYFWLAIHNIYQRKVPHDSLGYFGFAHCCCRLQCYCRCCCCGRVRLFCDRDKMAKEHVKQIELNDQVENKPHPVKSETNELNLKAPAAMSHASTAETDEYADIDLISINSEQPSANKKAKGGKHLKTKSGKYLDLSMVKSRNSTRTVDRIRSTDIMPSQDAGEFTELPTYQSDVHRDCGLMQDDDGGNRASLVYPEGRDTLTYDEKESPLHVARGIENVDHLVMTGNRKSDTQSIVDAASDSDDIGADDMIIGIKCVVYLFDVFMENINTIYDYNRKHFQARIRRLTQHFEVMEEFELLVVSNTTWSKKMKDILDYLQLRRFFGSKQDGFNIIGYDHEWVANDNKNLQLMLLNLIKHAQIQNDELLFVGNKKVCDLVQSVNVCQTYDVDQLYPSHTKQQREEKSNGTLKGRDLAFLESQILASI
eukprot:198204_1